MVSVVVSQQSLSVLFIRGSGTDARTSLSLSSDEGASLRMGYEALLTSAVGESRSRQHLADELMVSLCLSLSSSRIDTKS